MDQHTGPQFSTTFSCRHNDDDREGSTSLSHALPARHGSISSPIPVSSSLPPRPTSKSPPGPSSILTKTNTGSSSSSSANSPPFQHHSVHFGDERDANQIRATAIPMNTSSSQIQQGRQGQGQSQGQAFQATPLSEKPRARTMPDSSQTKQNMDHVPAVSQRVANFAMRGQGVDVSDMDHVFGVIDRQVDITIVDMNQDIYKTRSNLNNQQFLDWLQHPRPEWSTVRWININGMSWDVIKAIAIEYDLHHLAVEDLLHVPQRTKVDIYPKQTYISCTLLTLMETLDNGELRQVDPFTSPHGIDPDLLSMRIPLEKLDNYKHYHYDEHQDSNHQHLQHQHHHHQRHHDSSHNLGSTTPCNHVPGQCPGGCNIHRRKSKGKGVSGSNGAGSIDSEGPPLQVEMEQVAIFLLQDGTLITLFQVSGQSVVLPIIDRLSHDYAISRKHNDASFLLQSVIDGIVDHAIPIADAFRQGINDLETHVLAMPRMKFTKDLHRMTAQLSLLKRTLQPTQILVHSLRGKDERSPLSSLARIYMGDVMDHCNTMVEDIDSMLNLCEKLINMIFNIIAYDTNESMRRLAHVSIIFLPITFIAGIYGCNFEDFPELKHNIGYFWTICGAVTAFVVAFIAGEYLSNEWKRRKVERKLRKRNDPRQRPTLLYQQQHAHHSTQPLHHHYRQTPSFGPSSASPPSRHSQCGCC